MLKKTITYMDFKGNDRTEDFYFHLSKPELIKLNYEDGGIERRIHDIVDSENAHALMLLVEEIILLAYGERSDDGRRFIKSPEISKAFSETEAYSELFYDLLSDNGDKLADFINKLTASAEPNPNQLPKIR